VLVTGGQWESAARTAEKTHEGAPELATTTLTRPQHGKVIAGVCAGIAERFGWSPFIVRLAFLLSCLLPGPQFIAYIVLWVIMPKRPY
jgi:phage shock protein PspC (stress-responsive transcriptional regulator)